MIKKNNLSYMFVEFFDLEVFVEYKYIPYVPATEDSPPEREEVEIYDVSHHGVCVCGWVEAADWWDELAETVLAEHKEKMQEEY